MVSVEAIDIFTGIFATFDEGGGSENYEVIGFVIGAALGADGNEFKISTSPPQNSFDEGFLFPSELSGRTHRVELVLVGAHVTVWIVLTG